MFTGLIQELGEVTQISDMGGRGGGSKRFFIKVTQDFLKDVKTGDSICINGACQTIEVIKKDCFQVCSIPATLKVSNLNLLKEGDLVNLELPLRPADFIGGHIVQGHIEGRVEIGKIDKNENHWDVFVRHAKDKAVIKKGSVCLDGISLTIQEVAEEGFSIQIIPETLKKTNLNQWYEGYHANIETDYLVRAVVGASSEN